VINHPLFFSRPFLSETSAAYTHRIGRTARGGASGTALTFVATANPKVSPKREVETAARDSEILHQVRAQQPRLGTVEGDNVLAAIGTVDTDSMSEQDRMQPAPLMFNVAELDSFRYRVADTLRSVTSAAVKELRAAEIKREILNSAQLKKYFAENPNDLKVLRHDKAISHPIMPKEHLKYIPDYLIPPSMKGVISGNVGANRKPKRRKTGHPVSYYFFIPHTLLYMCFCLLISRK
jgi:ATP-dependent RNA helicase DDX56/DBP9